tara:strand:- start:17494 stop:17700 length:207 start_codon:yes stop_codon:yes gene_type:complete
MEYNKYILIKEHEGMEKGSSVIIADWQIPHFVENGLINAEMNEHVIGTKKTKTKMKQVAEKKENTSDE